MAITFVQAKVTDLASSTSTTVAATLTNAVNAGDLIVVYFGTGNLGAQTLTSIADGHNTYHLLGTSTAMSGAGYVIWAYYAWNVASAGAGALTITATFGNGASSFNFMLASEYTGVLSASDPLDVWSGWATGTSATASVSATPGTSNDVLAAGCIMDDGGEAAGSGYTLRGDATNAAVLSEDKILVGGGGVSQTATATGTLAVWLIAFGAFKPAGGAAATITQPVHPDRPADSPSRAGMMFVSGLNFVAPVPKPTPIYTDQSRGSRNTSSDMFFHGPPWIAPVPKPQATFTDRMQDEAVVSRHMFSAGPPWIAPIPTPSGIFPDEPPRPPRNTSSDPFTALVTPVIAAPVPSGVFPDAPPPPPRRITSDFATSTFVAPAIPKPNVWYPDRGQAQFPALHLESTRYPFPPPSVLVLPIPVYPDTGAQLAAVVSRHLFAVGPPWIAPTQPPLAVYPDRGQPPPIVQHFDSTRYPFVVAAVVILHTPSFPDAQGPQWRERQGYVSGLTWIAPALYPMAVFPDVGAQLAAVVSRHTFASGDPWIAPVPSPMAVYPDTGAQLAAVVHRHLFTSGLTFTPPRVNPSGVFPDRGTGQPVPAWVHMAASGLTFVAPIPSPEAIFPDHGTGYLTPAWVHFDGTRYPFTLVQYLIVLTLSPTSPVGDTLEATEAVGATLSPTSAVGDTLGPTFPG